MGAAALLAAAGTVSATQASQSDPKSGYLITYSAGPAFLSGKPLNEQPLKAHLAYMLDLHRRGVLRMAGGFDDNSGGAAFIDAASLAEARQIAEADPAITSKVFVCTLHQWNLVPWQRLAERSAAG
jgi:uncharacterized protein YciI